MESLKDNATPSSNYAGKWIIATVTGNTDPKKVGRVQISVAGLVSDNPWAVPDSIDGGGGGGDATQDIPAVGSQVYVKLQDGKVSHPMYKGAVVKPGGLPAPLNGDPNIFGWIRGTTSWWVNKKTGEAQYTGPKYTMHIDPNGNVTVNGSGNLDVTYSGATFHIPNTTFTGNVNIGGNLTVTGATTVNGGFTSNGGTGGTGNVAVFNGPIITNSNLTVGGNLSVSGSGTFGGNVSAPNIH